jgi:hypothetical protein
MVLLPRKLTSTQLDQITSDLLTDYFTLEIFQTNCHLHEIYYPRDGLSSRTIKQIQLNNLLNLLQAAIDDGSRDYLSQHAKYVKKQLGFSF